MIIAGGSAYPRQWNFAKFRQIADSVGAFLVVDMAHFSGLVAAGLHPNPCEFADIVTTTTHKTLRGPRSRSLILAREKYGAAIDKNVFPGVQGGPLMRVGGGQGGLFSWKPCSRSSRSTSAQVIANAKALSMGMRSEGFRVVSGGTDTHLLLVDVFSKGVKGREAENALDRARITVNKNAIPFDTNPPMNPSGIRLGSPAVTTRGFREEGDAGSGARDCRRSQEYQFRRDYRRRTRACGDSHRPLPALQLVAGTLPVSPRRESRQGRTRDHSA